VFAVMLGIALASIGGSAATLEVFDKIQQAMIAMIQWIMSLAPFGVAALIADVVANSGLSILKALLVYILVTCVGLLIHTVVIYGGLVRFGAGMTLWQFLTHIRPAQLIAFSTSSSAAALPVTIKCAEENMKISKSVASFVLPLGATVNMDGTALYQGVSAIFIAQIFGIDLSLSAQMTIVLTATIASIGTASVPGSGVINLALVLGAIGIPAEGIAIIIGADRVLDMFRTTVNVTGDLAVAAVIAKSENEFVG
jgi:Na+/H+-dicarboxylate symporter